MKKCPHCGMNIRDNVEVCGYCGGEIAQQPARSTGSKGAQVPQRNTPPNQPKKRRQLPRLMNRKTKMVRRRAAGSLPFSSRANRY